MKIAKSFIYRKDDKMACGFVERLNADIIYGLVTGQFNFTIGFKFSRLFWAFSEALQSIK
jgi:hypothetical protein